MFLHSAHEFILILQLVHKFVTNTFMASSDLLLNLVQCSTLQFLLFMVILVSNYIILCLPTHSEFWISYIFQIIYRIANNSLDIAPHIVSSLLMNLNVNLEYLRLSLRISIIHVVSEGFMTSTEIALSTNAITRACMKFKTA